jgi:hypothetical protein
VLVATARVLRAHWPADTLAGIALGLALASVAAMIAARDESLYSTTPSRPLCEPMYQSRPFASTTILRIPTFFDGRFTTRICSVLGSKRTTVSVLISFAQTAPDGMLWITLYGNGKLAKLDPVAMKVVKTYSLPAGDGGPYAVTVDGGGMVAATRRGSESRPMSTSAICPVLGSSRPILLSPMRQNQTLPALSSARP